MSVRQAIIGVPPAVGAKCRDQLPRHAAGEALAPMAAERFRNLPGPVAYRPHLSWWIMAHGPGWGAGMLAMRLTLYVRRDCHLCADMYRELLARAAQCPFSVDLVDIDSDADLAARYGNKVPVLVGGNEEICHYFLDEDQLARHLSKQS